MNNNEDYNSFEEDNNEQTRIEVETIKYLDKVKIKPVIPLDWKLKTPEERNALVTRIVEETPKEQLTPNYLKALSNYIIEAYSRVEKSQSGILSDNHMATVNKRETSFQGLASSFEQGEDGLYNLIIDNDKNILLTKKIEITEQDLIDFPEIREIKEAIEVLKKQLKTKTTGRRSIFEAIKNLSSRQYEIKMAYRKPIHFMNLTKSISTIDLSEEISVNDKGDIVVKGLISLCNAQHVSALLSNYSKIKESVYGNFSSDFYYLMEDLDKLVKETLEENEPILFELLIQKIDGRTCEEIRQTLITKFNKVYSIEYISSLWKNKIPKLIAEAAEKNYLNWYFTEKEKGQWKKCSKCGQIKLANHHFFSKNNTSKDGFYSHCKECRAKKYKEKKE